MLEHLVLYPSVVFVAVLGLSHSALRSVACCKAEAAFAALTLGTVAAAATIRISESPGSIVVTTSPSTVSSTAYKRSASFGQRG